MELFFSWNPRGETRRNIGAPSDSDDFEDKLKSSGPEKCPGFNIWDEHLVLEGISSMGGTI